MRGVGGFVVLLILAGVPASAQPSQYRDAQLLIETEKLAEILSSPELRLVDVRPLEEYRQGHLAGAVNLPAPALDSLEANRQGFPLPPDWAQRLFRAAGISAASRVVLYDDQGNRFAARAFYVLEFFGHGHLQILNGGIRKWQREGRSVTTDTPTVPPGDFTPQLQASFLATAEWVNAHLKDAGVKLIDARSAAEFRGDKVLGARGGHIPGAVNIEWTRVIESGEVKTFLDAAALEKLFADAGVDRNQEAVTYCQMGIRAAELYFVLRLLGYERVRIYDGSWEDWSAIPDLPVEK